MQVKRRFAFLRRTLGLARNAFSNGIVAKITKTKGSDKEKNIKKSKIHEKTIPEINKKRSAKTELQKSKNTPKMTSK